MSYFQLSNVYIYVIFPSFAGILLLLFIVRSSRANANSNLPPSPSKLPLIGNLHQFGSLPHRTLHALSKTLGPIISMHVGHAPVVIVSSTDIAAEIMKTLDLSFASRPYSTMAKLLLYNCDIAFAPYGEYWRQVKKLFFVQLLSNKMVQSFRCIMEEEVEVMIRKIYEELNPVNLSQLIVGLNNDIICRMALGKKYSGEVGGAHRIKRMMDDFSKLLGSFPVGDFIPWLSWVDDLSGLKSRAKRNFSELDEFLEKVIEEHVQIRKDGGKSCNDGHDDFVDLLLSIEENDESVGISFGRNNIKALVLDTFAAGTDTTSTVMEWAMAELITNPKTMKKVQKEIREVGLCSQYITDKQVDKMTYLKAIVKETLRLHPPLPLLIPRATIHDVKLEGYHIPKGTRVMVNVWAIGQDNRIWENPEDFLPDRFIGNDIDVRGQDFELIPFGAGRRMCPAVNFAIPAVEVALANLLYKFDWEVPKMKEGEVTDMSESPGLTIHKKHSLILVAKPWNV